MFATPQEAQHAIDTFDGWEVDGRIIKVRWDKFQGSTSSESPSQPSTAGLAASPHMMHSQLSPAQTPRPGEFAGMTQLPQAMWSSQYPQGQMRPMAQTIAGPSGLQTSPGMTMTSAQPAYGQTYMQSSYLPSIPVGSSQTNQPQPQSQYPVGMVYNPPPTGWYPPSYSGPSIQQPSLPQVRLPSAANVDPSQIPFQQNVQPQNVQRTDQHHDIYPYGSSMYTTQ